jgi:nucleotide-binding universal stress UspA family protein
MAYASLLVHIDAEGDLDGRIELAAALADRFQSRLIGAAAKMPRPAFAVEGVVIDHEPTEKDRADMRESLRKRGEQFQAAAQGGRRVVEWRSALEFPAEFIAREARAADLVIISREPKPYDPYRYADAGALVLRAGRPVLVVPAGVRSLAPRRVLIAWKDTREARRAVADALPFLHVAAEVILLEVCERGDEQPAQTRLKDVASYLSNHRLAAVTERVRPVDGSVSHTLLRLVEEQSVDLVVAGAYGHSRLGEWIFGGMTQDLLTGSPVCCLLSH